MEVELGNRPSYARRNIFKSRELLQQGLWWRVGDGRQVNIWGDRWLTTLTTFSVQSTPKILSRNAKVMELIDPNLKRWNVDLISTVFSTDSS